jgi:hypothetical protein
VVYVSEVSRHAIFFARSGENRISTSTNLYDDDVCPWLHLLDNQRWIGDLSMCGRKKIKQGGTPK